MTRDRDPIEPKRTELSRDLCEFDITMIGVGAMIGAGIFVLTGIAAGAAGPALMLSFALNGVVTLFTAMVYAELGSAIPEAGGGYLWVKDALGKSNGFLAGWMSWFSHAVAGSLYALGFGSYLALLLEELGVPLFGLHGPWLEKGLAVGIALLFVFINFRGASETGMAGNVVTLGKLAVIAVFVAAGLIVMLGKPEPLANLSPFLPRGTGSVFVAMGLTFIAFEGYEIIVQAGEEVQNPRRAIPRAVFWSLIIVIPIYVLVAIVAVGAIDAGGQPTWQFLGQHKELGMVEAARQLMPFGTLLLLFGGLLSTVSALNATTYSSTRVAFAMGRDRGLPGAFSKVHGRTKTPYVALLVSGAIIITMVLAIPIQDVAAAADVMFLLLFLQVNYAVMRIRDEFGDRLEYGYLMPFYPWVPILGIVGQAFLAVYLYRYSPTGWYSAGAWILVGLGVFFAYSRSRLEEEERPRIAYRRSPEPVTPESEPVVVALTRESYVETEIRVAAAMSRRTRGPLIALAVVRVPGQLPLSRGTEHVTEAQPLLRAVADCSDRFEREVETLVVVGHSVSKAVVHTLEKESARAVVLGWRGKLREHLVRGSDAERVLARSPSPVVVVKDNGLPDEVEKVSIGVSPGLHARTALDTAISLAGGFDAVLRVFSICPHGVEREEMEEWFSGVKDYCREQGVPDDRLDARLVDARDVFGGLLSEGRNTDLFVVGASNDWILKERLFGTIPDKLANELPVSVVMVKEPETAAGSIWRRIVGWLRG